MSKFLGFVLIHPVKEDFVSGLHLNDGIQVLLYGKTPHLAKIFNDFDEIEEFVLQLEEFDFDVAKLSDAGDQYFVEFETTVSSS